MKFRRIGFTVSAVLSVGALLTLPARALAAEGSFDRTLQVSGAVNLQVETGAGSIEVHAGGANQVQVHGRIKVNNNWFGGEGESNSAEKIKRLENNPPIQQSGNVIRIGHIDDPELRRNLSISYEVIVPAETQLRSHTGSGNQVVSGIHGPAEVGSGSGELKISTIDGALRADTGSGNIEIDHVNGNVHTKAGSGSIHATGIAGGFDGASGSGNLTLEQTAPGSVHVDTGSGTLELRGIKGSLEARAGSGNIRAEGEPTGAWTLHSGSGGIKLRFPATAAFDLSARTGSGSISVDHPLTVQGTVGRKEVHGKVLAGGPPVEADTGSGNIEID